MSLHPDFILQEGSLRDMHISIILHILVTLPGDRSDQTYRLTRSMAELRYCCCTFLKTRKSFFNNVWCSFFLPMGSNKNSGSSCFVSNVQSSRTELQSTIQYSLNSVLLNDLCTFQLKIKMVSNGKKAEYLVF